MRPRAFVAVAALLAVAPFCACEGEPDRAFFNDMLQTGDATVANDAESDGAQTDDGRVSDATWDTAARDASAQPDGTDEGAADAADASTDAATDSPVDDSGDASDSGCNIAHSNGLGQTYYDCVEAGTFDETQAMKACNAYVANGGTGPCQAYRCYVPVGSYDTVCSGGGHCICWGYGVVGAGQVGTPLNRCYCATADSGVTWN